jgi:hypothetical protein
VTPLPAQPTCLEAAFREQQVARGYIREPHEISVPPQVDSLVSVQRSLVRALPTRPIRSTHGAPVYWTVCACTRIAPVFVALIQQPYDAGQHPIAHGPELVQQHEHRVKRCAVLRKARVHVEVVCRRPPNQP